MNVDIEKLKKIASSIKESIFWHWNQFYTLKTVLFKAIQTLFYKNHHFINAIKHKLLSTSFFNEFTFNLHSSKSNVYNIFSYFYRFLLFEVILLQDTKYKYLYSAMIQTLVLITLWKSNPFHHWSKFLFEVKKKKLLQIDFHNVINYLYFYFIFIFFTWSKTIYIFYLEIILVLNIWK